MTDERQLTLPDKVRKGLEDLLDELQVDNDTTTLTLADNNRCVLRRIKVAPELSFVIKHAPLNLRYRDVYQIHLVFQKEIYMYEKVFDAMQRLQRDNGLEEQFEPFAKCFKSNLEAPCEYLIMEDLATRGYATTNKKQPLDLAHCELVIKSYAKFHALALALKEQRRATYDNLLEETRDRYYDKDHCLLLGSVIRAQCNEISSHIDAVADARLIQELEEFSTFPDENLAKLLVPEAADGYAVFCHGDAWSNNILFKYQESDSMVPTSICMVDWQRSRCTSPATDLSCFLFSSTDKKFRDEHYHDLLSTYHNTLRGFLAQLGSDPDLFPFDVLTQHMQRFSKYGLAMTMVLLQLQMYDDEDLEDLAQQDVPTSIERLDRKRKLVFARLLDVVRDFDKFEYFTR